MTARLHTGFEQEAARTAHSQSLVQRGAGADCPCSMYPSLFALTWPVVNCRFYQYRFAEQRVNHLVEICAKRNEGRGETVMKSAAVLPIVLLLTVSGTAQSPTPASATSSPAKSIGMFAYPKNQQSAEQQAKDERECYASAKQESGVDPQAPPPTAPSAEEQKAAQQQAAKQAEGPKGGAVKGSARGAAGGAAIGAIAGDAGTGAAVGATAGAVRGRRQQKKAEKAAQQQAAQQTAQAQQQSQAQANAQYQNARDTFKRAFSACMDARGYSVK